MSSETPSTARPVRKWLGPVLLVSLVVNLFLVAAITAGIVRNMDRNSRGHASPLGLPHHIIARQLSGEEREKLKAAMRENRAELRHLFRDMRQAREALSEAIAADPYDPEAARTAFAELRAGMDAMATRSQDILVQAFADLTPESREKIAEAMRRGRPGERARDQERDRNAAPSNPE
ncbi:Spy/CpxP family protein refolding chaperone [Parvibaculaceae bacterium PLY_AMNH_Bact1]|nr:Spy/CpxP family protein refolding chaperone [Parvibaculaceae bacterium PLY_AMNH_Bact1]